MSGFKILKRTLQHTYIRLTSERHQAYVCLMSDRCQVFASPSDLNLGLFHGYDVDVIPLRSVDRQK